MARPSKFGEDFIPQARKLCKLGATDTVMVWPLFFLKNR
ncbi:hypothetical protein J2W30_006241 [Variovorax boronicumulans]|nr:hypothetical protein [Variovorax boronicumulans]